MSPLANTKLDKKKHNIHWTVKQKIEIRTAYGINEISCFIPPNKTQKGTNTYQIEIALLDDDGEIDYKHLAMRQDVRLCEGPEEALIFLEEQLKRDWENTPRELNQRSDTDTVENRANKETQGVFPELTLG